MRYASVLLATVVAAALVACSVYGDDAAAAAAGASADTPTATLKEAGDLEGLDLTRQGTPSNGPCPAGCKCFANEEACQVFVDCHNAGLKAVPGAESIDPQADCIDLSQNNLPATPGMFAHFPARLAYLELHGNKFGEGAGMPGNAFATLPNLVHLGLEQNALKSVPADLLSGLTNLKVIYLSHNELASLPSTLFAATPDLRVLLLQHNKLEKIEPGTFAGLKALKVLKLVDNPLAAKANATDDVYKDLTLFQLDLQTDNGDYYEDTMLEGLKSMADLGKAPVDEDAVKKLQEQGKVDEDLFSMDDFSSSGIDSDADAFVDESDSDALKADSEAADDDALNAAPEGGESPGANEDGTPKEL